MTYVDAEGATKAWVNGQMSLVGVGNPLVKGGVFDRLEGTPAPYAYITAPVPATGVFGAESPTMRAPIAFQVYGPTKESANIAAIALAEALNNLDGKPETVTLPSGAVVTVLMADNLRGPAWLPDFNLPRYTIDVDMYLA